MSARTMIKTTLPGSPGSRGQRKSSSSPIKLNRSRSISDDSEALQHELRAKSLAVIVLGASGDLAKKKTYPALLDLWRMSLLPRHVRIYGYARSKLSREDFIARIRPGCEKVGATAEEFEAFLGQCVYVSGQYDSREDFAALNATIEAAVAEEGLPGGNRVFYLALPPSVFASVSATFKPVCMSATGWNRVIVEKPFGRDLDSCRTLVSALAESFTEEQQYRIDHYLGKEMVQNLLTTRFGNIMWQPLWHRNYINCVCITFKENFGTEGRGGYFDNIGILRDVMQNHLLQMLTLVAMERPISLDAEAVRDEKVKVLKCIDPVRLEDAVLGQYTANADAGKPGYKDDATVPEDSNCATFASAVLFVENERWAGVPFILKCGKALNERIGNVRIQFKVRHSARPVHTCIYTYYPQAKRERERERTEDGGRQSATVHSGCGRQGRPAHARRGVGAGVWGGGAMGGRDRFVFFTGRRCCFVFSSSICRFVCCSPYTQPTTTNYTRYRAPPSYCPVRLYAFPAAFPRTHSTPLPLLHLAVLPL